MTRAEPWSSFIIYIYIYIYNIQCKKRMQRAAYDSHDSPRLFWPRTWKYFCALSTCWARSIKYTLYVCVYRCISSSSWYEVHVYKHDIYIYTHRGVYAMGFLTRQKVWHDVGVLYQMLSTVLFSCHIQGSRCPKISLRWACWVHCGLHVCTIVVHWVVTCMYSACMCMRTCMHWWGTCLLC